MAVPLYQLDRVVPHGRSHANAVVALVVAPRWSREIAGRVHVLETAIVADFALVRAAIADTHGNLLFSKAARNFNVAAAMAARVTIVEAEKVVPAGDLDPDRIHLPGIFVTRVVALTAEQAADKPIEKRVVAQVRSGVAS